MEEDRAEVKAEGERVGIRFPDFRDDDGFHWLSLDQVWAFLRQLTVAVREAWVNHEERRAEETFALTEETFEEEAG
jgi:hypothetical protein